MSIKILSEHGPNHCSGTCSCDKVDRNPYFFECMHNSYVSKATGSTTCVLMGTQAGTDEHMRAVPFTDQMRSRLERFKSGGPTTA